MGGAEKNDASDEYVRIALARIRELVDEGNSNRDEDDALLSLREKLLEIRPKSAPVHASFRSAYLTQFRHFVWGRSDRVEAVIAWLRQTDQFDDKQIERIRRIGLLEEKEDGSVVVREQPISESLASLVAAFLASMTGGWITWVWFAAEGNVLLVSNSYAVGWVFGTIVGYMLDKSFRFAKMREKVISVAPRLRNGVSVGLGV